MILLAHRGDWFPDLPQNSPESFLRALNKGYGIETDVRDYQGQAIISHDPYVPSSEQTHPFTLDDFLTLYNQSGSTAPLALNIKADGLQSLCREALNRHTIDTRRVFFFDMSLPDSLGYLKQSLPCYTRYSDEEQAPLFLDRAAGVWVDGFYKDPTAIPTLETLCHLDRPLCFVSPELHGRPHQDAWHLWQHFFKDRQDHSLMLCTDYPDDAQKVFMNDD